MLEHQLEQLWLSLKAKGLYQNFSTYAEYQEAQKAKGIVDLREKLKVGMMNPKLADNPALSQLKAEAKAFDEANGIVGEIDPALIPF